MKSLLFISLAAVLFIYSDFNSLLLSKDCMGFTSSCSKVVLSKMLLLFWKELVLFLPFHLLIFFLLHGSACLLLYHLCGWPFRGIKQKISCV